MTEQQARYDLKGLPDDWFRFAGEDKGLKFNRILRLCMELKEIEKKIIEENGEIEYIVVNKLA